MLEENIREWGEVYTLGALPIKTQPDFAQKPALPLLKPEYSFASATYQITYEPELAADDSEALALAGWSFPAQQMTVVGPQNSQALAVLYPVQRIIESPVEEDLARPPKKIAPFLLIAAFAIFAIWQVYHLTWERINLRNLVDSMRTSLSQREQENQVLAAPTTKVIHLQDFTGGSAEAKLFWDTNNHVCLVYLNNLPQISRNQDFQLWYFTSDARFISVKIFKAEQGKIELRTEIPAKIAPQIERVIVSLESQGGSPFPLGPILLRGSLR